MAYLLKSFRLQRAVKETIDNLPNGLCYFDKNGYPLLCNRQMRRLAFALLGRDLRCLEDFQTGFSGQGFKQAEKLDENTFRLKNGKVWHFASSEVTDSAGRHYTQLTASDVTRLREQQELLLKTNEERLVAVDSLKRIQENVLAIAREEEILAMKMQLHGEYGANLQTIRRFYENGCPMQEKQELLHTQKKLLARMRTELRQDDQVDEVKELWKLADSLNIKILVEGGKLPSEKSMRRLLSCAVRECLINTVRHAGGDELKVTLSHDEGQLTAVLTNNGNPPKETVKEGGGLSSLRSRIESFGGTMKIQSKPEFKLTVNIPWKGDDSLCQRY